MSGLDHHYRHKFRISHPSQFERRVAQDLCVSNHIGGVFFCGNSGATLSSFKLPSFLLSKINPKLIIIELGTNDLVQGESPDNLALQLVHLAKHCNQQYNTVVALCSVLPRNQGLFNLTPDSFRCQMADTNSRLKTLVDSEQNIIFHTHKGFWNLEVNGRKERMAVGVWSDDGIHPNSCEGRKKYKNSLRTVICKALKLM